MNSKNLWAGLLVGTLVGVGCSPPVNDADVRQGDAADVQSADSVHVHDTGAGTDSGVGTDAGGTDAGGTDAGAIDAGGTDAGGTDASDGGSAFTALAPCLNPADYVMTGTTITFPGVAFAYSPRCLTVRAGAMVTFNGPFSGSPTHPLAPSTRGTVPNPITPTSMGTSATFTFANPGFYPYYCTVHGSNEGTGMAGVIQVIP